MQQQVRITDYTGEKREREREREIQRERERYREKATRGEKRPWREGEERKDLKVEAGQTTISITPTPSETVRAAC